MPKPVTGGAFAFHFGAVEGLYFIGEDGKHAEVVRVAAPRRPTAFAVDRSNGDTLAWVESDEAAAGGYEKSVLWTTPFATTLATTKPRKVASLEDTTKSGGGGMVANRGHTLTISSDTTARITRLSDGAGWTVYSEPGEGFVGPLWIDDDEVFLVTAKVMSITSWKYYLSGMTRLRRDTLGPPDFKAALPP